MMTIRLIDDIAVCRNVWEQVWPGDHLFDAWQVRECFHKAYDHPICFVVAEENGRVAGLMALSWAEELGRFCHFPGEIWNGKTWLEQNKVICSSQAVLEEMFDRLPGPSHVRYLLDDMAIGDFGCFGEDEIGYFFYPDRHHYSFDHYWNAFPGKKRKKLAQEMARLENMGVEIRHEHSGKCLDLLFRMNLEWYGENSYFCDPRFLNGFIYLTQWLEKEGALHVTTVTIGGKLAAIDMGAIINNQYTVLAGGTDACFPGVAKLINFHHLAFSCERKFSQVDFLCGDFGWKCRFNLSPRPYYAFTIH